MKTHTTSAKRLLLISFCLMLGATALNAQSSKVKITQREKGQHFSNNTFYIGILGSTIPGSLNYEHIWTKNGIINIGTKIGGFYSQFRKWDMLTLANGSIELNLLMGKSKHMFEMGFGWTAHYASFYSEEQRKTRHYAIPTKNFSISYRYQKPGGGIFFKAGLTTSEIEFFATNDLTELAIVNAAIIGFDLLTGDKPSFRIVSIGVGYSFK